MKTANYWIENLKLAPHPEGGFFKETYRSEGVIPKAVLPEAFSGDRSFSTSIYFLLNENNFSAFHKINQDELWHFYDGVPLTIHVLDPDGNYYMNKLGRNIEERENLQVMVNAGCYFAAECNDKTAYSLVGCTVAPGFDFDDFEMPARNRLIELFPAHKTIIEKFTLG